MQIECSPTFMYVITENGASGARGGPDHQDKCREINVKCSVN
jgi:hypothetical protein